MIRFFLTNLFFFTLPFLIYAAYMYLVRRKSGMAIIDDAPVLWLLGAGALLASAVLVYFLNFDPVSQGGKYIPPTVKDGVIVPGHFE